MLALIFGVLFAVSFLGFAITSRTKYSAASHLFWGADWSEESILNVIKDAIRLAEE